LGISALCIGACGGGSGEKNEASGTPHRSEFSFHFIVPFEQMSCDDLLANAKDAMEYPGRSK
jgi:hypothetical protein